MLKSDSWIINQCLNNNLIEPYSTAQIRESEAGHPIISRGCGSFSYDLSLAEDNFRIMVPLTGLVIDMKRPDARALVQPKKYKDPDDGSYYYILPKHSYALGMTVETLRMPPRISGIAMSKYAAARSGILINTTFIVSEWVGQITLEIGNLTQLPVKVYINEGIAQIIFIESDEPALVPYNSSEQPRGFIYNEDDGDVAMSNLEEE